LFNDPVLKQIAAKHKKTVPQVMLRWQIQRRVIVIPKTSHKSRMNENINIFDFEISEEDLQQICRINKNKRLIDIPGIQQHPDYPFAIPY
jgi:diketogulonate reductase-like aldo/keto reductase